MSDSMISGLITGALLGMCYGALFYMNIQLRRIADTLEARETDEERYKRKYG
jgi:hypothetical protein